MASVALLVMALALASEPVVPPLPSCNTPALMVVVPVNVLAPVNVQVLVFALMRFTLPPPAAAPGARSAITPMVLPAWVPSSCNLRVVPVLLVIPAVPMVIIALPASVTGLLSLPPDMLSATKLTPAVPLVTLPPLLIVMPTLLRSSTPSAWVIPAPAVARLAMIVPPLPDPLNTE